MKEFFIIALVHFLSVISPGPSIISITNYTINNGIKNIWKYALGIALAQSIYIFLSLFGIMQIILRVDIINKAFCLCSGLYLLYLGYSLIKSKSKINIDLPDIIPNTKIFKEGFLITLSNPNVPIFYSSVLTSFINSSSNLDFLLLISIYLMIATFTLFYLIALIFNKFRNKIVGYMYYIEKVFGICLWYFGAKLLLHFL